MLHYVIPYKTWTFHITGLESSSPLYKGKSVFLSSSKVNNVVHKWIMILQVSQEWCLTPPPSWHPNRNMDHSITARAANNDITAFLDLRETANQETVAISSTLLL